MGPANDGRRYLLNVQPVIPISLNAEWNLISRTIVQLIDQQDVVPGEGSQSGAGNIVQSLFLSPALPTASGVIWGAGPAFLLPTASVSLLGSEKWGIGPTGVALRQQGAWTVGALATPLHAAAGDDDAAAGSWQFEATPYLWAAGLDGTLAINNRPQQSPATGPHCAAGFLGLVQDPRPRRQRQFRSTQWPLGRTLRRSVFQGKSAALASAPT